MKKQPITLLPSGMMIKLDEFVKIVYMTNIYTKVQAEQERPGEAYSNVTYWCFDIDFTMFDVPDLKKFNLMYKDKDECMKDRGFILDNVLEF